MKTEHTTDLPETPTFQQAYAAAKEEHSKPAEAEPETPDEATTEGTEDEVEADEETPEEEPAPAPAAKTKKGATTTSSTDELLTDEEFSALQTKYKDDSTKLRKELTKAFTQKTQALADEKRSVERLSKYAPFIDLYEENPEAAIKALVLHSGVKLGTETAETPVDETSLADEVMGEFKTALGPELEYLADGLAPAITKLVERLAAKTVETATKPLKDQTKQIVDKAAESETASAMASFTERHPDWEEHEEALVALSQKLQPNGMTEVEYLDHLYKLVTAETPESRQEAIKAEVAKGVKAAMKKMQQGAEDADTVLETTPARHVKQGRPENATFADAYEAAKRGERWD